MTRETAKQQIDMMPDNAFEVYSEMFAPFVAYVIRGEKQNAEGTGELPKQKLNKVPEKVTSFSQLIGTLPQYSRDEIRAMRLADKEKRLSE
ncbi:MAG: hypothetical protein LBM41_05665 [Ruminococcus sp.]|nr:hypothetical protein [Ruminococcus sp.]